jgi:hypothetical protein
VEVYRSSAYPVCLDCDSFVCVRERRSTWSAASRVSLNVIFSSDFSSQLKESACGSAGEMKFAFQATCIPVYYSPLVESLV